MKSELGREISDRLVCQIRKFPRKPLVTPPHRAVEALHCDVVLAQEIWIAGCGDQTCRIDRVQEFDGIMLRVFPNVWIETLEEKPGPIIPAPFQVICELFQALNAFWNL